MKHALVAIDAALMTTACSTIGVPVGKITCAPPGKAAPVEPVDGGSSEND